MTHLSRLSGIGKEEKMIGFIIVFVGVLKLNHSVNLNTPKKLVLFKT